LKDKTLDLISPVKYKNTLLIPISKNIEKLFGLNKIFFQLAIKDNKITLESPSLAGPDFPNDIHNHEAINES